MGGLSLFKLLQHCDCDCLYSRDCPSLTLTILSLSSTGLQKCELFGLIGLCESGQLKKKCQLNLAAIHQWLAPKSVGHPKVDFTKRACQPKVGARQNWLPENQMQAKNVFKPKLAACHKLEHSKRIIKPKFELQKHLTLQRANLLESVFYDKIQLWQTSVQCHLGNLCCPFWALCYNSQGERLFSADVGHSLIPGHS